ncbi:MAG: hypothetical protein ABIF77_13740 [bacterium]
MTTRNHIPCARRQLVLSRPARCAPETCLVACLFIVITSWPGAAPAVTGEFDQESQPEDHLVYALQLEDGVFRGVNEHLPGFTYIITIMPDSSRGALDEAGFMAAIAAEAVTGSLTYPTGTATAIEFQIAQHRDSPEVYMKTRLGYFLWEAMSIQPDVIKFVFDFWYTPPATPADLEVIEKALSLLAEPASWRRADDRRCDDDRESGQWSLFCALKHATESLLGEYNHHGKAQMSVRTAIQELTGIVDFEHTLMDFNNAASTRHEDILLVLDQARKAIAGELEE